MIVFRSAVRCGIIFALATILPVHGAVSAQARACLAPAEAEAIAIAALPDVLTSARRACLPHLPARSALAGSARRIADVYRPAADLAWPDAGRAFLASADVTLPPGTDLALVRPLLSALVTGLVEKEIKPSDCNAIDEFYGALEPLPPENIGRLMVALMKLDSRTKKSADTAPNTFMLCPEPGK